MAFRVLLLCYHSIVQWRVARCARQAGCEVHVLGGRRAFALRYSTVCKKFAPTVVPIDSGHMGEAALAALTAQINEYVAAERIHMVLPTDGRTTRILSCIRDRLAAPCFPIPSTEAFDTLNDKWRFNQLCLQLGVDVPHSTLFADAEAFGAAHEAGALWYPGIAKPVDLFGKIGINRVDEANAAEIVRRIDYAPVLYQDFVEGGDVCITIYAREGKVTNHVVYRRKRARYFYFQDDLLLEQASRVAAHYRFTGVLNFDARVTPSGRVPFIECNPRFWNTIDIAMLMGLNFVALGIGAAQPQPRTVNGSLRLAKATALALLKPWTIRPADLRLLAYVARDPVPYACIFGGERKARWWPPRSRRR